MASSTTTTRSIAPRASAEQRSPSGLLPTAAPFRPAPRGSRVVAYWSSRTPKEYPNYHLDIRCSGFERVRLPDPETETIGIREFKNLHEFGADTTGRPCRVCALELVADTVLRPAPPTSRVKRSPVVFASFSSQANPNENLRTFKWGSSSESGEARLRRIAARLGATTTVTSVGPVAFGFFPLAGAQILAGSLRTVVQPRITRLPPLSVVGFAWTLMSDDPPELRLAEARGTELAARMQHALAPGSSWAHLHVGEKRIDPLEMVEHTTNPWELAALTLGFRLTD